jgi:chemotaxis response regulator CheB
MDKAVVMLLSGGEVGSLEGLRQIKSAGGAILAPHPDHAILQATMQAAADENLITALFEPKDMEKILKEYCG